MGPSPRKRMQFLADLESSKRQLTEIPYLKDTIPSGKYTIEIAIAKTKHFSLRIASMKLRLSNQEAIRYKLVEDYMPYTEEPENNLGGFVVEAGLATFCDANAVSAYENNTLVGKTITAYSA